MLRIVALVLVLLTTAVSSAAAQQYPDRPITVLTGYPAGGMVDIVARALADGWLFARPFDEVRLAPLADGGEGTIDAIAAGWDGWNPMLAVSGVAIRDRANADGPPVLLLPRVDATIAWTSLLALDLRLRELSIERPQLSVRRDRATTSNR